MDRFKIPEEFSFLKENLSEDVEKVINPDLSVLELENGIDIDEKERDSCDEFLREQNRTYRKSENVEKTAGVETFDGDLRVNYVSLTQKESEECRGLVFFFHGFSGNTNVQFIHYTNVFASLGFDVFFFDQYGHGKTRIGQEVPKIDDDSRLDLLTGRTLLVPACRFVQRIQQREQYAQKKTFFVGESMGGLIMLGMMHFGNEVNFKVDGMVLVAPALEMKEPFWKVKILGTFLKCCPCFGSQDFPSGDDVSHFKEHQNFVHENCTPLLLRHVPKAVRVLYEIGAEVVSKLSDHDVPFIVFHGSEDDVVKPCGTKKLMEQTKDDLDKCHFVVKNGMHSLVVDHAARMLLHISLKWVMKRV